MVRAAISALVLLGSVGFLLLANVDPARAAEKADGDEQAIRGAWTFVKVLDQGEEQPVPEGMSVVITADMLTVRRQGQDAMGQKYTIDPSRKPKEMDLIAEIDPGRPIRQLAIYELQDDTLKIAQAAAGKPRPKDFESRKGDFGGVWILKRAAAPKAGAARKSGEA